MNCWWMRLARYGFTQWRSLTVIIALMGCGVLFGLLRPWPMKLIVDHLLQKEPWPEALARFNPGAQPPLTLLAWLTAATLVTFLGGWLARTAQNYFKAGAGNRMIHALGADLFHHLQGLSLRFHGQRQTGDLAKRITTDNSCVRQLMLNVFLPTLTSMVTLAGMLAILWKLDSSLAVVALLVTPMLGVCIWVFAKPMTRKSYAQYELQGAVMAHAEQTLTALPLIRAFSRETHEENRFSKFWQEADQAYRGVVVSELQFKVSTGTVTALGTAIVMAVGGTHVLQGTLTVGGLLVFLSYLASLYSPLETLAYLSTGFAAARAGAKRVFEVMDADKEIRESPTALPVPSASPVHGASIRFDKVHFGYDPDRPVLRDVSFEARPGEIIGLVGATGSGKSTLASLMPRFFDPWNGRITFNGVDLRDLSVAGLRNQFSIVLQDPFILPLSVADNIAYGCPGADRARIVEAATTANAAEFINALPNGYDEVIGERGETLSGGQRQRLAIARALLKDAPVLILDEPTAALDTQTEASLIDALQRLMKNRTTFIIAHRFSTIRDADRIMVLDQGRIAETGAHDQLLASGGLYARLHALQSGKAASA